MTKTLALVVAAAAAAVLLAWGATAWRGASDGPAGTPAAPTTTVPAATMPQDGWAPYRSDAYGFSVRYPEDWTVDPGYAYTLLGPDQAIRGVAFRVPADARAGTNLAQDSAVSVERADGGACTPATFLGTELRDTATVTENGRSWQVGRGGGAGAGNFYDETVHVTEAGGACYGIRLFIHTTNVANYDPGTVTEFDRSVLDAAYAQFRASFATL